TRSAAPSSSFAPPLAIEAAGQKKAEHAEVADQRPGRMAGGRGPVALEDDMTEPGESIAGDGSGQEPAPIAREPGPDECGEPNPRAEVMQPAGARVAMRGEIHPPELGVSHRRRSL